MEELNEDDIKRIKSLYEHGQHIGALFTSEVDLLVDKPGVLDNNKDLIYITKVQLKALGKDILDNLYYSNIHPHFWSEFLLILSRDAELMKSEAERIRREHNNG